MLKNKTKQTTVVNFFGGPGSGKSTFCAGVFAALKWLNVCCEMSLEYAKDLVWSNDLHTLENQYYVFAQQQHRLYRLYGQVDIVITDAPLLNTLIYDAPKRTRTQAAFTELVLAEHDSYDNLNFFIERHKPYQAKGRLQTEKEAVALDDEIRTMLLTQFIPFTNIPGLPENMARIVRRILEQRKDIKIDENLFQTMYPEVAKLAMAK